MADGYQKGVLDAFTAGFEMLRTDHGLNAAFLVIPTGSTGEMFVGGDRDVGETLGRILTRYDDSVSVEDILAERAKQRERWGDKRDDDRVDGVLADAASWLADPDPPDPDDADDDECGWAIRLKARHAKDRRRQLVIAAALLVAEIDRLDRALGRTLLEERT